MQSWPTKDPEEVLDYQYDWSQRLKDDEIIAAATCTVVVGGAVVDSTTFTPQGVVTVWVSGGTLGEVCQVLNHITTSAGREYEATARLRIRAK